MLIRSGSIGLVLLFLSIGCKKQNISDEFSDEDFPTDPAIGLFRTEVIESDQDERIVDVEFFQVNGINSETDFSDLFIDLSQTFGVNVFIESNAVVSPDPAASYTNVLMVQTNGTRWMEENQMTLGISRFFNQVDESSSKKAGVVTFQYGAPIPLRYPITTESIFNTSAEENKNFLYGEFVSNELNTFEFSEEAVFAAQLNEVMDSLILSPMVIGQKMITIVDEYENNGAGFFDTTLFNPLLDKAILNDIQVNLITTYLLTNFAKFAYRTGGYVLTQREGWSFDQQENGRMNSLGVLTLNLDQLSSRQIYRHAFRLHLTNQSSGEFVEDEILLCEFVYNNERFVFYSFAE